MFACVLLDRADPALARRLFAVTPLLERVEDPAGGQIVLLDVSGTSRLHGGVAGLFAAIRAALAGTGGGGETAGAPRMALAGNRFTAEIAARSSRHPVTVAPGDEALFLSRMPLGHLPMSAELERRLRPLGLETLGDLASLPVASVDRRYGPEGVALQRLARGEDERGLLPERPGARRSVWRELDDPVDRLDRLRPALEDALAVLCRALEEEGLGALALRLQVELEPLEEPEDVAADGPAPDTASAWDVSAAAPETRGPLWLDLLALRMTRRPPPGPVTAFQLEVHATGPVSVHQGRLFGDVPRDPARRTEALSRLVEHLGPHAVGSPTPRAAHRLEDRWRSDPAGPPPDGDGHTRRTTRTTPSRRGPPGDVPPRAATGPALRLLPQPELLVPVSAGGRLLGFRHGRRELPLGHLSPPRRLEGGWWAEPWARDEHDLQPRHGGRLRICRDLGLRRWLLLGEFD